IDQSRSMNFGGRRTKFELACRTAAAICYLAAKSLDRVRISTFDSNIRLKTRSFRGRGQMTSVTGFLARLIENVSGDRGEVLAEAINDSTPPDSRLLNSMQQTSSPAVDDAASVAGTDLSGALRRYQRSTARTGIVFVISDFMDSRDFKNEMRLLAHRGFDLN